MAVQITQGTQTSIYTKTNAGTDTQVVKLDIGSGTALLDFGGTILTVGTLNAGTVALTSNGTLTALAAGTITTGTIDTTSQLPPNSWGTVVSSGTNTLGTIKPLVSGSQIFVTYMVVSVGSASNVVVASGGTSTPIAGTWFFNANGGITLSPIAPPIQTVSGSALVYQQSTGGPITITAGGFVR